MRGALIFVVRSVAVEFDDLCEFVHRAMIAVGATVVVQFISECSEFSTGYRSQHCKEEYISAWQQQLKGNENTLKT